VGTTFVAEVIACRGPVGTSCNIAAVVSVRERLRGKRVVAVSAQALKTKRITIGSQRTKVAAGATTRIKVALNHVGMTLRKHFKHFSARLVTSHETKTLARSTLRFVARRRC
jgi:hypothetical protein